MQSLHVHVAGTAIPSIADYVQARTHPVNVTHFPCFNEVMGSEQVTA